MPKSGNGFLKLTYFFHQYLPLSIDFILFNFKFLVFLIQLIQFLAIRVDFRISQFGLQGFLFFFKLNDFILNQCQLLFLFFQIFFRL